MFVKINSNLQNTNLITQEVTDSAIYQEVQKTKAAKKQIWLIFGSSMNPPHLGHVTYLEVLESLIQPDRVIVIPAKINPHKQGSLQFSPEEKEVLVKAAIGKRSWTLDNQELLREGTSYTYQTIDCLFEKAEKENAVLFLTLTDETASQFHKWSRPEQIVQKAVLIYGKRPGNTNSGNQFIDSLKMLSPPISQEILDALEKGFLPIAGPFEVSSTEIRQLLTEGKDTSHLVGPEVVALLQRDNA